MLTTDVEYLMKLDEIENEIKVAKMLFKLGYDQEYKQHTDRAEALLKRL